MSALAFEGDYQYQFEELSACLVTETSTLGLRYRIEKRQELERASTRVRTPWGEVRVKTGRVGQRENEEVAAALDASPRVDRPEGRGEGRGLKDAPATPVIIPMNIPVPRYRPRFSTWAQRATNSCHAGDRNPAPNECQA